MATGQKKVIVRRFSPGLLRGYVHASGFVSRTGQAAAFDLLDLEGRMQSVPLAEVKMAHFVREFNMTDNANPERLPRKQFLGRPRTEGLWMRLQFRDGDELEGLASLDMTLADELIEHQGLQLIPPDIRGNSQRIYIPRSALTSLQVVAVVTTPTRRKLLEGRSAPPSPAPQHDLFAANVEAASHE